MFLGLEGALSTPPPALRGLESVLNGKEETQSDSRINWLVWIMTGLFPFMSGWRCLWLVQQVGISQATYYLWKRQYAGLGVSELRELRQLREENGRLKRLVADLSVDRQILQEIVSKKL